MHTFGNYAFNIPDVIVQHNCTMPSEEYAEGATYINQQTGNNVKLGQELDEESVIVVTCRPEFRLDVDAVGVCNGTHLEWSIYPPRCLPGNTRLEWFIYHSICEPGNTKSEWFMYHLTY
jgi:hypothetical protein